VTKRILVVCDGPVPHARMNYRGEPLVAYLGVATDYEVDVVCPRPDAPLPLRHPRIRYHYIAPYKRVKSFSGAVSRAADIARLARVVHKIAVRRKVHCVRSISSIPTAAALLARRGRGFPVVANLSDFYTDLYASSNLPLKRGVGAAIQKVNTFAARADGVIVDSKEQRDAWVEAGVDPSRCYSLPHGIPRTLLLSPHAPVEDGGPHIPILPAPMLLYVGDISQLDGVDLLFRAIAKLRSQGITLSCLILGQGSDAYKAELSRLSQKLDLAKEIVHVPSVPNRALPELMSRADVLVAPFRLTATTTTAIPNKLLEYLSTDRPIVITATPTLRRTVGSAVAFVAPEDVEGLAAALRGCVEEPSTRGGDLSVRRSLRERLSWVSIMEVERAIIDGFAEGRPPDPADIDFRW